MKNKKNYYQEINEIQKNIIHFMCNYFSLIETIIFGLAFLYNYN